jgi:hypothetical protein
MAMLRKGSATGMLRGFLTTPCPPAPKILVPLLYSELGLMNKNQKTDDFSETAQSYFFIRANCMITSSIYLQT